MHNDLLSEYMENAAAAGQVDPIQRTSSGTPPGLNHSKPAARSRRKANEIEDDPSKRRCVSTACTYTDG